MILTPSKLTSGATLSFGPDLSNLEKHPLLHDNQILTVYSIRKSTVL